MSNLYHVRNTALPHCPPPLNSKWFNQGKYMHRGVKTEDISGGILVRLLKIARGWVKS